MANLTGLSITGGDNPITDVTVNYTLTDGADGAAVSFVKNSKNLMRLYMPGHGGATNAKADYSGWGWSLDVGSGVGYNATGGHSGSGCLTFDGTNNAKINAKGLMSGGSYTKSCWVYLDNTGNPNHNFISGNSGHAFWAPYNAGYLLKAGHGTAPFNNVTDTVALVPATWYHVCVTYDAYTGTMTLYKDGVQIDQTVGVAATTDCQLWVGNYGDGTYGLNGRGSDFRYYDHVLSAAQVAHLAAGTINIIDADGHESDDVYYAEVTPFDGTSAGATQTTSNLTVEQGPGTITLTGVSLSATNTPANEDSALALAYTESGTTADTGISWYVDGEPWADVYMPMEGGATEAAKDFSGRGNDSVAGAGATWNSTGGHDGTGAWEFDGSATAELTLGNVMTGGTYTKIAWVKRSGTGKVNFMSGAQHAFWAPDIYSYYLSAGNNPYNQVQDTVALVVGTWYHVAVVYDADADTMKLYKNGVQVGTTATSVGNYGVDRSLWVGAYNGSSNLIGSVDEAIMLPIALSDEQILAHYNSGMSAIDATSVSRWDTWKAKLYPFSTSALGDVYQSNSIYANPLHQSYMCLGDSITKANIGSTDGGGYRSNLWDSMFGDDASIDFVGSQSDGDVTKDPDHEGYAGYEVNEVGDMVNILLDNNKAGQIFLHLGTNDLGTQAPADVVAEMELLLDNIAVWETMNHKTRVYVAQIIQKSSDDANWSLYNALLATAVNNRISAGDRLTLIDMESILTQPTDYADLLHPNDAGYAKIATAWYSYIVDDFIGQTYQLLKRCTKRVLSTVTNQITGV